ncbi:MAG: nucleotidyltransferase family protein [Sedimentisphaerales bacterium]|nr:nucleotidyltransferase family protein [Sedimentisphaerales bacterium]
MSTSANSKAVILARGLGTRMRRSDDQTQMSGAQAAAAASGLKAMIPIDRPFLDYVLHDLAEAGFRRICLVIGPEHTQVRQYYHHTIACERIQVEFAIQEKPLGTADAVAAAESFAAGDPIVVLNSDNYYPPAALAALHDLDGSGLAAFERQAMLAGSNIAPDRITTFAVVQIDASGLLRRIVEKPDARTLAALAEPICVSMNCWRFGPAIFEACRRITPSPRGELEITDAVQYAIEQLGEPFRALVIRAPVLDMSYRSDVPAVAAKLQGKPVHL